MPETLFVFRSRIYATFALALAIALAFTGPATAQVLDNEKATFATLSGATYTLTGHSELHITGTGDPIPGCTIHLNSADSWVFFHGVAPASVVTTLIPRIRVNGANAVTDTNVRVVQHVAGTVVIPQSQSFAALQVFTGQHLSGPALKIAPYAAQNNASLGLFADRIRSFVLKRGYTATFAQNENGTGASRNYVAQDGDLEVSILPADLDKSISFIRVFPWRWTGKKGSCDVDPVALNADWNYNWNISSNSTKDWEYVAIKQQRWWPGLDQDWKARGVNHVSGFNEPDNPVEDAYTSLDNGSTTTAVAAWPDLLSTGLRVGAPAVTDGGYNWIVDFMNKANAAGVRVDYVPVHYYRSYSNAADPAGATTAMYNFLKGIYDATGGRPIWVTEFNNGANWTTGPDPSTDQNRATLEAMINMMDSTPWIERYAVYSNVEWFRKTHYDDGALTPMGTMYRDHVAPMAHRQVVPNSGSSSNTAYLFEGNVRDTLGGNNPVIYGTPKIVAGKNGSAVSLDGTDDYLALPGRIGDSTDFSFAAWVKWNGGNNWQRIFDLGNGTASYLFLSPKSGGGDNLRFSIKLNNGTEQLLNAPALAPGVWTHVAVTIAGDTGKLFVNGGLVNTNTGMTINPSQIGTEANYLGKSQFTADPNFSGLLDDVRFFNTALTDAQVSNLATATPRAFLASPVLNGATVDLPFTANLNTQMAAGAAVTFTKVEGPAWLAVAADGAVSGVPGLSDIGANELLVRATTATGGMSIATVQVPVAASSQVVRFGFNSNTVPSVGKMDATLTGGPIYSAGRSGTAIDLDGTDDFVQLPLGVASSPEFTVSTWVYWDGGGNWQRIFDFGNGTTSNLFLTPKSGSNTTMFSITHGGVSQNLEGAVVPASTWTHLVVTIGAGTGKLYINGSLAATNASMSLSPADVRPTVNYLGKSQWPDPLYNGRIDDFQVFHRVLSATEINTLRTGTPPVATANPRNLPAATIGVVYEGSLEGAATGTVTYSKVGGPAWLTVEADGRVSGVPGLNDSGNSPFRIRATASGVLCTDFELRIPVGAPADLRAHYELNGVLTDTIGTYGATGQGGGPTYIPGAFEKAADLDGTDDYVQMPAGMLNGLSDCTFATRFRWDGGSAWQRVFDFGNNNTQYLILTPSSAAGTLRFSITVTGTGSEQMLDAPAPAPGEWVSVAVVLSGNTGMLYVNGALVSTNNAITLDPATIAPVVNYLGKSQWPDPYFNGAIDDLRIYNRALNATEVRSLAVPPAATIVPRTGYSAWKTGFSFPLGQSLPESDPDRDGHANLIEWLLGTDPVTLGPDSGKTLAAQRFTAAQLGLSGNKTYLGLTARIRKNRPATTLIPEAAATPAGLAAAQAATQVIQAGLPVSDGDFEIFTWYYTVPIEDGAVGFIRLRVIQN